MQYLSIHNECMLVKVIYLGIQLWIFGKISLACQVFQMEAVFICHARDVDGANHYINRLL